MDPGILTPFQVATREKGQKPLSVFWRDIMHNIIYLSTKFLTKILYYFIIKIAHILSHFLLTEFQIHLAI